MKGADNVKISLKVTMDNIPYEINKETLDSITYLIMESLIER